MTPQFPSNEDDVSEVADWVEMMVLSSSEPFKRGTLVKTLEREDARLSADEVIDELQQRAELMADRWPLELDADTSVLSLRTGALNRSLYTFLAALGLRVNIDHNGRVLFEECVTELSATLVGRPALRIGHPRRAPMPAPLKEAIERYCEESAELEGIRKAPASNDKDLGLDVAAWWEFKDQRGGYLHFLGQCATGADWVDKLNDLHVPLLKEHIYWAVEPVRFFATPFVIHHTIFRRSSIQAGLVLDRPRLMELAERGTVSAEMEQKLNNYTSGLYN